MPPCLTRKTHVNSAAVPTIQCHLHSCGHQKITQLTIVSSSKSSFSSESNGVNRSSVAIRENLTEKTWKNGRFHQGFAGNKSFFSAMVEKPYSRHERRHFWRKSVFGTKKFRSIILLNVFTIIYGRASFISLFTVIVIPLLESVLGVMVPARTWFGILMSVCGISMLECCGSPPNVGDLFNFLSSMFFGIHTLRMKHISRTVGEEKFSALLGYEVGVVAVLSTIWCLVAANLNHTQDSEGISWTWELFSDWIFAFPWVA